MNNHANDFWQFTLAVYPKEGFSESCIWLQDERGLDVNLLIFCLWCGLYRSPLSDAHFGVALELSRDWKSSAIQPLRDVRRWLKDRTEIGGIEVGSISIDLPGFRQRVQAVELEGEQLHQQLLQGLVKPGEGSHEPSAVDCQPRCEENLFRLLGLCGVESDDDTLARCNTLTAAALSLIET